jgi:hypothetical protein
MLLKNKHILLFLFLLLVIISSNKRNEMPRYIIEKHLSKFNLDLTQTICCRYNNPPEIICIAFPEYMRYAPCANLVEVKALNLLYTQFGTQSIDFSTGIFQMKLSFIEQLEREIMSNPMLHMKYGVLSYFNLNDKAKRKERIRRVSSDKWQIIYLNAFYDYCISEMNPKLDYSKRNKFIYVAGIYNLGLSANESAILHWKNASEFYIPNHNIKLSYAKLVNESYDVICKYYAAKNLNVFCDNIE